MIKKLFKYDFNNMTKTLKWFYLIVIGVAILTRLVLIGKKIQLINIIGRILLGCTYSAVANVLINMFIHIPTYLNRNFYKDESYLTHTLPISKNKLFLSKCLSALTVILISVAVCVVGLLIVFLDKSFITGIKVVFESIVVGFNMPAWLIISLLVLLIFAEFCTLISMGNTAIIKANTYNQKRGIKGVIWFMAYYFGATLITLIISIIVFALTGNINALFSEKMPQSALLTLLIISTVLYVGYVFVHYFIANKIFNKGVNVD